MSMAWRDVWWAGIRVKTREGRRERVRREDWGAPHWRRVRAGCRGCGAFFVYTMPLRSCQAGVGAAGRRALTRKGQHGTLVLVNAQCGRSATDTILALMKAYRNPYSDNGASTLAA